MTIVSISRIAPSTTELNPTKDGQCSSAAPWPVACGSACALAAGAGHLPSVPMRVPFLTAAPWARIAILPSSTEDCDASMTTLSWTFDSSPMVMLFVEMRFANGPTYTSFPRVTLSRFVIVAVESTKLAPSPLAAPAMTEPNAKQPARKPAAVAFCHGKDGPWLVKPLRFNASDTTTSNRQSPTVTAYSTYLSDWCHQYRTQVPKGPCAIAARWRPKLP